MHAGDDCGHCRDQLAAAGCEVVTAPAMAGKLKLPLMALPDIIVLYSMAADIAGDMIERLRAVGFEMPVVVVSRRDGGEGDSGHRYTVDTGKMDTAAATDWLVHLPTCTATERPDHAAEVVDGAEGSRGDLVDASHSASTVSEDAEGSLPETLPTPPAGVRAGRRRAGAAPLGRRFQMRGPSRGK